VRYERHSEGELPGRAYEQTKAQLPQHILEGVDGIADTITRSLIKQRRKDACVNCWYIGEADDIAMWKKYAPRNGVAIKSTVKRLCSSLGGCTDTNIHIGRVTYYGPDEFERYIDHAIYGSLFNKLDPLRSENELRALAYRTNSGAGIDIPVDAEILIERLLLSPELAAWAVPSMIEAILHFGVRCQIDKSSALG
jgi:hypothetical protein